MDKDLRALLGRPVAGRYRMRYCGKGERQRLRRGPLGGDRPRGRGRGGAPGHERPGAVAAGDEEDLFTPLPLAEIQYTNRPSGIHMLMQFAP